MTNWYFINANSNGPRKVEYNDTTMTATATPTYAPACIERAGSTRRASTIHATATSAQHSTGMAYRDSTPPVAGVGDNHFVGAPRPGGQRHQHALKRLGPADGGNDSADRTCGHHMLAIAAGFTNSTFEKTRPRPSCS